MFFFICLILDASFFFAFGFWRAQLSTKAPVDYFTLTYDGSAACSKTGENVGSVTFSYHMFGSNMSTLLLTNAVGEELWSLNCDQGDSWKDATVDVHSPAFAFKYIPGNGNQGEAELAQVRVSCEARPPPLPTLPPSENVSPVTFSYHMGYPMFGSNMSTVLLTKHVSTFFCLPPPPLPSP